MSETIPLGPLWNRALTVLMLAFVGALFYGTVGGLLTIIMYFLGWIPGMFFGILHGYLESRRTPLREAAVMFIGCVVTAGVLIWRGNLAAWGFEWIVPSVGLGSPLAGVLLSIMVRALGPVRCRQSALFLSVCFITTFFGLIGWLIYRPVD